MEKNDLIMAGMLFFSFAVIAVIAAIVDYHDDKFKVQQFQICVQATKNISECKLATAR